MAKVSISQQRKMTLKSDALWFRFNGISSEQRRDLSTIVEGGAKETVQTIKENIYEAGIRRVTGNLLDAVGYDMVSMLHARIFIDTRKAPYALDLEEGIKSYDMKRRLLASPKAKTSEEGYKYIRVPLGKDSKDIRTISTKTMYTKANKRSKRWTASWKYPGYTGKLFFQRAIEEVEPHIVQRIEDYTQTASLYEPEW